MASESAPVCLLCGRERVGDTVAEAWMHLAGARVCGSCVRETINARLASMEAESVRDGFEARDAHAIAELERSSTDRPLMHTVLDLIEGARRNERARVAEFIRAGCLEGRAAQLADRVLELHDSRIDPERRLLALELPREHARALAEIGERCSEVVGAIGDPAARVLRYLAERMWDGWRRPGSWERELVARLFGGAA